MAYPKMSDQPPAYHEAAGPSSRTTSVADTKGLKSNQPRYALISISWTDRIRLMRFPDHLTARVSETLQDRWPKGIQKVKTYHGCMEFKLKGNPFAHGMDDEKIAIRNVLLGILDTLAREGWCVHPGAGGLGRIGNYGPFGEKDSLVFQRQQPLRLSWMCVSFDSDDLMHLINAPPELAMSLMGVFGDRIQCCNQDLVSGSFEVKFKGTLWSKPSGEGAVQSRLAILDVLQCLEDQGYALCASLDLDEGSGGHSYKSSGETWFCCRS